MEDLSRNTEIDTDVFYYVGSTIWIKGIKINVSRS